MTSAQSALTLRPASPGAVPSIPAERAAQIAHQFAGIPAARVPPELIVFTDAESFGLGHREVLSWVVALEPAAIASRPNSSGAALAAQQITLRAAVDATSGYCMALFTECKAEWVHPRTKHPPSAAEMLVAWHYARIEGDMNTKGIQALVAVVNDYGVDFSSGGQVVVRPMVIDRDFPAIDIIRIGGTQFVPVSPATRAWLVATSGLIAYRDGDAYSTEGRYIVRDADGKVLSFAYF